MGWHAVTSWAAEALGMRQTGNQVPAILLDGQMRSCINAHGRQTAWCKAVVRALASVPPSMLEFNSRVGWAGDG